MCFSCHTRNSGEARMSAKFMKNIMMRGRFEPDDDAGYNTMSYRINFLEELACFLLFVGGPRPIPPGFCESNVRLPTQVGL